MKYSEHLSSVKIAYIGGGSLNWAPKLMADLAHDTRLDAEVRLYDIDHAAAERNARMGARFADVSRGKPAQFTAKQSLSEALEGADIVVVSILPGRFEDMAQDIAIPAQHGIVQSVGDTVGPGGFLRALRAIPMMLEIGEAIAKHAPQAHVCNLSNPMSVLTGALFQAFPGISCWGECHEVTKLRKRVAWIANQQDKDARWTHRDVAVNVLGINHFTFVDRIELSGRDMAPAYQAFCDAHAATGWTALEPDPDDEHARYFEDRARVSIDLSRRFGVFAAAGDRHLAEFLPAHHYLADPEAWSFALTPVEYRVRYQEAKRLKAEALAAGTETPVADRSEEALVDQIAGLVGGSAHVSNVNMPNLGQISGLPKGTIVETNAIFSGLGVTPVVAGRLPDALNTIVEDHANRQSALLRAVVEEDFGALFGLFHADPLVAPLPRQEAREMFRAMIAATATYLPENIGKEAA